MTAPGRSRRRYSTTTAARSHRFGVAAPISRHSRAVEKDTRHAVIASAARASARLGPDTSPAPDVQPASVTGSS